MMSAMNKKIIAKQASSTVNQSTGNIFIKCFAKLFVGQSIKNIWLVHSWKLQQLCQTHLSSVSFYRLGPSSESLGTGSIKWKHSINHWSSIILTFINRLHCWITKGKLLHVGHFTPGAVTRKLFDDHCCCHMLGLTTKHWGQGWKRLTQWPPPAENIYVTDWQSSVDWGQVRLYHDHTHTTDSGHHWRHRAVSRPETWGPVIILRLFWESWFYVLFTIYHNQITKFHTLYGYVIYNAAN